MTSYALKLLRLISNGQGNACPASDVGQDIVISLFLAMWTCTHTELEGNAGPCYRCILLVIEGRPHLPPGDLHDRSLGRKIWPPPLGSVWIWALHTHITNAPTWRKKLRFDSRMVRTYTFRYSMQAPVQLCQIPLCKTSPASGCKDNLAEPARGATGWQQKQNWKTALQNGADQIIQTAIGAKMKPPTISEMASKNNSNYKDTMIFTTASPGPFSGLSLRM